MAGTYNANANTMTLADAVAMDPKLVGTLYNKELREGAQQVDDFSMFEGPVGSKKPFLVRSDLREAGADKVTFTVASQLAGPGVRGERELTGNTSTLDFLTYQCYVDYFRDAFEPTKKQLRFMSVGGSVRNFALQSLKRKLGLQRMNDMKMMLKLQAVGNIVYPNGKRSVATLDALDTLSTSLIPNIKPVLQRIGGKPFSVGKNDVGSPVNTYTAYIPDVAMSSIRNSNVYGNAMQVAMDRGKGNPTFTGLLQPWQGVSLFEHHSADPDVDDHIADPFAPRAILSVGFGVDSAIGLCLLRADSAASTAAIKQKYFEWFRGHAYEWYEDQTTWSDWTAFYAAITDDDENYAWIRNTNGSVGFVKYDGGHNGKYIQLTGILSPDGAGTSTIGSATLGNFVATGDTWDSTPAAGGVGSTANTSPDFQWTDTFTAGAYIIPCNANGAPDMSSILFGAHCAVRCYGQEDMLINQDRDYGFVKGAGYETIYGQAPCIRTDGITNGYLLVRHTGQHQGLEVPTLTA